MSKRILNSLLIQILIMLALCSCERKYNVYCLRETLPEYHRQEVGCELYLRGNKYSLDLTLSTDEIIGCPASISFGTVKKKNGTYILRDYYTGFETTLKRGSNFLVSQSFPFLEKKHFVYLYKEDYATFDDEMTADFDAQRKKIAAYNKIHPEEKPLRYGCYMTALADFTLRLEIGEDHQFKFSGCGLLFSEGIWSRDGNIIQLHGKGFSEPYYLFVEDDKLIGVLLLPGFYNINEYELFYGCVE